MIPGPFQDLAGQERCERVAQNRFRSCRLSAPLLRDVERTADDPTIEERLPVLQPKPCRKPRLLFVGGNRRGCERASKHIEIGERVGGDRCLPSRTFRQSNAAGEVLRDPRRVHPPS